MYPLLRATPWPGAYCASKAALHSLTDTLDMELRPFGVRVLLLTPGFIQTNVTLNQTGTALPSDSLYTPFLADIRGYEDQTSSAAGATPLDEATEIIVSSVLASNPPRYLTLAANSTNVSILRWLPRTFVLSFLWRYFTRKSRQPVAVKT
jgi:1-acylglycerone phosphate reductase